MLFQAKTLKGTAAWGRKLVADVGLLQQKTTSLTYQAPDLANGAQELLDEVAATKITGEEERYSHIDLVDMANNVEGAEQAFADLEPALQKIDPDLAKSIGAQFTRLGQGARQVPHQQQLVGLRPLHGAERQRPARARRGGQGGAGTALERRREGRERRERTRAAG